MFYKCTPVEMYHNAGRLFFVRVTNRRAEQNRQSGHHARDLEQFASCALIHIVYDVD